MSIKTLFGIEDIVKIINSHKEDSKACVMRCGEYLLDGFSKYNTRNQKLPYAKQIDIDKVERALDMAGYYHNGIPRKSGEPYICHPICVAYMSGMYDTITSDKTDIICAALLHDVLEDTKCIPTDIKNKFGLTVANMVQGLTYAKDSDKSTQLYDFFERVYNDNNRPLAIIKVFDRIHNLLTCSALSRTKQVRMVQETLDEVSTAAAIFLDDKLLHNDILKLAYHVQYQDSYTVHLKLKELYGSCMPSLIEPLPLHLMNA